MLLTTGPACTDGTDTVVGRGIPGVETTSTWLSTATGPASTGRIGTPDSQGATEFDNSSHVAIYNEGAYMQPRDRHG